MATLSQTSYRWRIDDGNVTSATWAAAVNTSLTGLLDHNYRIRIVSSVGGIGGFTIAPKHQYNKNAAGWNDVNTTSSVARTFSSAAVADNVATTAQIVGNISPGRTDTNGVVETSTTISDAGDVDTEHEYCLQ